MCSEFPYEFIIQGDYMPVAHKSLIAVGLLYIPIGLYKTTRNSSMYNGYFCSKGNSFDAHIGTGGTL